MGKVPWSGITAWVPNLLLLIFRTIHVCSIRPFYWRTFEIQFFFFLFVSFFKPFSMVIIMYKCFYYYCWLAFSHFKHCVWPEVSDFFPFFLLLKIVIFTISQQISVMIKECVKYCWACKLFIVHVMTVTWHDVSPFNTLKWSLGRLNTYILLV